MEPSARFDRSRRLTGRRSFEQVFRRGTCFQEGGLTLSVLPVGGKARRLGCVVGRIVGGAVQRNRLKRWLREAFRKNQEKIPPGMDVILRVRAIPPKISYRFVEERFLSLCERIPASPSE